MVNRGESRRDKNADEFSKHCDAQYVNGECVRHKYLVANNLERLCNPKGESDTIIFKCYVKNTDKREAECELTLERLRL
jgi:hypothetical protein